jgi:hypothetical protein
MLEIPIGGIYDFRHCDDLKFHDMHSRFHKDWVRDSEVNIRGHTHTHTQSKRIS